MIQPDPTIIRLRTDQSLWEATLFWVSRTRREVGVQPAVWAVLTAFLAWGILGLMFVPGQ